MATHTCATRTRLISAVSTHTKKLSTTFTHVAMSTSTRPTALCTRANNGHHSATCVAARSTHAKKHSEQHSLMPADGSVHSGSHRMRNSSTSSQKCAHHANTNGMHAGGHQSPTQSTCKCANLLAWWTSPRSTSSTLKAQALSTSCNTSV